MLNSRSTLTSSAFSFNSFNSCSRAFLSTSNSSNILLRISSSVSLPFPPSLILRLEGPAEFSSSDSRSDVDVDIDVEEVWIPLEYVTIGGFTYTQQFAGSQMKEDLPWRAVRTAQQNGPHNPHSRMTVKPFHPFRSDLHT